MTSTHENFMESIFDEMLSNGTIYEEDENGLGMSWMELAEISEMLNDAFMSELENCGTLEEAAEVMEEASNAGDDVFLFWSMSRDELEDAAQSCWNMINALEDDELDDYDKERALDQEIRWIPDDIAEILQELAA